MMTETRLLQGKKGFSASKKGEFIFFSFYFLYNFFLFLSHKEKKQTKKTSLKMRKNHGF